MADREEMSGEGHPSYADEGQPSLANTGQPDGSAAGHDRLADDGQPSHARPLSDTIAEIRYWHRQRVYAMEQRKRANLSLAAFLRTALGWSKALPDADRKRINAQALALIDMGEKEAKGKPLDAEEPAYLEWRDVILASLAARAPFEAIESRAENEMGALAKSLPVWTEFGDPVRGFGAVSLAIIVAEAGDLSDYPKKGHLWKRMGVAVLDGIRQGGLRKTASADDWIAHGYNRQRRSRMWNIGDALIKNGEYYREVYLARKEYERKRAEANGLTVAPSAKIPAGRKDEFMSDGHIHRRAQRYMEKRLLRDLWQAWRDHRTHAERPKKPSPATEHANAA